MNSSKTIGRSSNWREHLSLPTATNRTIRSLAKELLPPSIYHSAKGEEDLRTYLHTHLTHLYRPPPPPQHILFRLEQESFISDNLFQSNVIPYYLNKSKVRTKYHRGV